MNQVSLPKVLFCHPDIEYVESVCRFFNPAAFLARSTQNKLSKNYKYRFYGSDSFLETLQLLIRCNIDGQNLPGEYELAFFNFLIVDITSGDKKIKKTDLTGFEFLEQIPSLALDRDIFIKDDNANINLLRPGIRVFVLASESQQTPDLFKRLMKLGYVRGVLSSVSQVETLESQLDTTLQEIINDVSSNIKIECRLDKDGKGLPKLYRELLRWVNKEGVTKSSVLVSQALSDPHIQILLNRGEITLDRQSLQAYLPHSPFRDYILEATRQCRQGTL